MPIDSRFTRPDTEPVTLPEPYAGLLAFLDDLAEQVRLATPEMRENEACRILLDDLEQRIAGMGLMVMMMAGTR
jgi:hypothetical protein